VHVRLLYVCLTKITCKIAVNVNFYFRLLVTWFCCVFSSLVCIYYYYNYYYYYHYWVEIVEIRVLRKNARIKSCEVVKAVCWHVCWLSCAGDPLLLSEWRPAEAAHGGSWGRVPRGDRVLPARRRTDTSVPREGGLHHGQGDGAT